MLLDLRVGGVVMAGRVGSAGEEGIGRRLDGVGAAGNLGGFDAGAKEERFDSGDVSALCGNVGDGGGGGGGCAGMRAC